MKTLLLTLTTMLLFSGCVYRVPSSTEHVTRTSYTYAIPLDQSYGIHRDNHYPVTNIREKKRYIEIEKHKLHHIPDPDFNRYSMKTEHTGVEPTVHPQYRQKDETVNKKSLKPKVHYSETRPQDNKNSLRPKADPEYQKKQKVEQKKKIGPTVHQKQQETRKEDNQKSSGPKVHPQYAQNKKRSDHSTKREETTANKKASKL
jgi:hypothetical protein